MAIIFIKRIFSRFCTKLQKHHDFGDVLKMYKKGDLNGAYINLCKVMENETCWSKDGNVYTLWAELEIQANHNPRKALKLLEKAKQLKCSAMGYYYVVYGMALWEKGEHEKAIHFFETSVEEDPSVMHLRDLAWAYSFMRDKRAINAWQKVLEKDLENCFAHTFIGWEAAKSGDRDKALLMVKKTEKLNPSIDDLPEIGRVYHELDEYQSAINKYLEAKKLGYDKDKVGKLNAAIADCYISLSDANAAKEYIQSALKCEPNDDYVKEVWNEYQERYGE